MMFFYRPGRVLGSALFWCSVWGLFVYMALTHAPHADFGTKVMLALFGGTLFCISAGVAATAVVWLARGVATFHATAWRQS